MKILLGRIEEDLPPLEYMGILQYVNCDLGEHDGTPGTDTGNHNVQATDCAFIENGNNDVENTRIIKTDSNAALLGDDDGDGTDTKDNVRDADPDAGLLNIGGDVTGNNHPTVNPAASDDTDLCNESELEQVDTQCTDSVGYKNPADNVYERDVICSFTWTKRGAYFGSEANPEPIRKVLRKAGKMNGMKTFDENMAA